MELSQMAVTRRRRKRNQTQVNAPALVAGENLEQRLLLATFRTIDGSGNNQTQQGADFGVANTPLIRFGYPGFYPGGRGNDFGDVITADDAPNPRDVSNAISAQSEPVYSARNLSDWVVQWGQFLTHDMDLTGTDAANNVISTGATEDFSVPILDPNDPLGPNPIPFNRSNFADGTGLPSTGGGPGGPQLPNWREQINEITSFIDASNVYGSDDTRASNLRTFVDGKLETTANGLLPGLNTHGEENDDPFGRPSQLLFLAGDVRANEQIGLTATHALFVREHNRLADLIKAEDASLTDEEIYQWARKIVGAQMQIITYEEFLPALMGNSAPDPDAYNYRTNVDASITNSFAASFFRFGHSQQSSTLQLTNDDGSSAGEFSLADVFFNPDILKNNPSLVDTVLKGQASQVSQENDPLLVDEIRNFLFGPPGAGGTDLASLDIQRGRDHGLLDFNEFRRTYGLQPLTSFAQLTSDVTLRTALESLYTDINSVDSWVGGIAEDHLSGSSIGPMLDASFRDQFTRLRDGDRFFYTGDPDLDDPLVTSVIDLDNFTLSELIKTNTGITNLQDNVFFTAAGFKVIESDDGTTVSESGTTDVLQISLNRAPATNVVLNVASLDEGEATVSTSSLTFTPTNWHIAQTVTVTGADDQVLDGDQTVDIVVSVNDAASNADFTTLLDQTISAAVTDNEVATIDLAATSFDADPDHVKGGQTQVAFRIANSGSADSGAFQSHVIWSANDVLGDADDVVISNSTITISNIVAGGSETRTLSLQLDQASLYANATANDIPGQGVGTLSADVSKLFLVVDTTDAVAETNESNNSGQGNQVDGDDITYFPWDIDSSGAVTPLNALRSILAVRTNTADYDFNGDGMVTPLEALGALQRIGYRRDDSVIESAAAAETASVSAPAVEAPVFAFFADDENTGLFSSSSENTEQPLLLADDDPEALDIGFAEDTNWLDAL